MCNIKLLGHLNFRRYHKHNISQIWVKLSDKVQLVGARKINVFQKYIQNQFHLYVPTNHLIRNYKKLKLLMMAYMKS